MFISNVIASAVLAGHDVFEVEAQGGGLLRQAAVFTSEPRPPTHKFAGDAVHLGQFEVAEKGLGLEHPEQGVGVNDGFQFRLLRGRQLSFGVFSGKLVIAGVGLGIRLHGDQGSREFDGKVLRKRTKQSLQRCHLVVCHARNLTPSGGKCE